MSDTKTATIRGALVGGILLGACILTAAAQEVGFHMYPIGGSGEDLTHSLHMGDMIFSAGASVAAALVIVALYFWPWLALAPKQRPLVLGAAAVAALVGTFFMTGIAFLLAGGALALMYAYATAALLPHDAKMGNRLGIALGSIGGLFAASMIPAAILQVFLDGLVGRTFIGCIVTLALGNLALRVLLGKRDTEATRGPR